MNNTHETAAQITTANRRRENHGRAATAWYGLPSTLAFVLFAVSLIGCAAGPFPPRSIEIVKPINRQANYRLYERAWPVGQWGKLLDRWNPRTGLGDDNNSMCGTEYTVYKQGSKRFRYARILFFPSRNDGRGPAGRGDYRVVFDEAAIANSAGGKLVTRFESYEAAKARADYYAWIAIISDRPIPCDGKN